MFSLFKHKMIGLIDPADMKKFDKAGIYSSSDYKAFGIIEDIICNKDANKRHIREKQKVVKTVQII